MNSATWFAPKAAIRKYPPPATTNSQNRQLGENRTSRRIRNVSMVPRELEQGRTGNYRVQSRFHGTGVQYPFEHLQRRIRTMRDHSHRSQPCQTTSKACSRPTDSLQSTSPTNARCGFPTNILTTRIKKCLPQRPPAEFPAGGDIFTRLPFEVPGPHDVKKQTPSAAMSSGKDHLSSPDPLNSKFV